MDNSTYVAIVLYTTAVTAIILTPFLLLDHFLFSKQRIKNKTAVNTRFVNTVRNSIEATLKRHPETPKNAKIVGDNGRTPTDFGHIYSRNFDLTFPIQTPTTNSYDTDSGETSLLLQTHAGLKITGVADNYFIMLKDSNNHLVYSSKTDKMIEQHPDRLTASK